MNPNKGVLNSKGDRNVLFTNKVPAFQGGFLTVLLIRRKALIVAIK